MYIRLPPFPGGGASAKDNETNQNMAKRASAKLGSISWRRWRHCGGVSSEEDNGLPPFPGGGGVTVAV
jgi:hypothetical protein